MFELPSRAREVGDLVERFFNERVLPNNHLWLQQAASGQVTPQIEQTLTAQAKDLGLWNMALPCRIGLS